MSASCPVLARRRAGSPRCYSSSPSAPITVTREHPGSAPILPRPLMRTRVLRVRPFRPAANGPERGRRLRDCGGEWGTGEPELGEEEEVKEMCVGDREVPALLRNILVTFRTPLWGLLPAFLASFIHLFIHSCILFLHSSIHSISLSPSVSSIKLRSQPEATRPSLLLNGGILHDFFLLL